MTREERAFAVLIDPRFHQAEWTHVGHDGPCPNDRLGFPCRMFQVGMTLQRGRCSWVHAPTAEEAIERAAAILLDGVPGAQMPGFSE